MLQPDSLVTDLMFTANASIDQAAQKALIDAIGGQAAVETKQLIDVDRMLDPRQEMELSPSMPFRRRGERRVMIIDDAGTTPRQDPQAEPILATDFRPAKETLIKICQALPIRLGRLFALGTWGDAVLVAKSARDLRGICLLPWALDPQVDVDGKRRATPLSQKEFEAKLVAFEKRLDELDEQQILASLSGGVSFERRGDWLVVDVLEADGTWDQRKSIVLETQLAAMERFSMIPGAPAQKTPDPKAAPAAKAEAKTAEAAPAKAPEPKPEPKGPPLTVRELDGAVMLVFPPDRFDLDVASALGKRDWDQVVRSSDNLTGATRDKIHRDGASWIAPLEFLSEVFLEGKPLTKQQFEKDAVTVDGVRSLEVHFPRFGDATLLDVPGKGRFVTSLTTRAERAAKLVM
nr:hypothetical protein [Kofleriaceae bacterium]